MQYCSHSLNSGKKPGPSWNTYCQRNLTFVCQHLNNVVWPSPSDVPWSGSRGHIPGENNHLSSQSIKFSSNIQSSMLEMNAEGLTGVQKSYVYVIPFSVKCIYLSLQRASQTLSLVAESASSAPEHQWRGNCVCSHWLLGGSLSY